MENIYSVAISYGNDLGYIEYEINNKSVQVILDNEEGKQKTIEFLNKVHSIDLPHETLLDFTTEQIEPLKSLENLQIALTKLWVDTGVHVDWSRPVDYVKEHRSYDNLP